MSELLERLLARAQAGVSEVTTCKVTPRELRDLVRETRDEAFAQAKRNLKGEVVMLRAQGMDEQAAAIEGYAVERLQ